MKRHIGVAGLVLIALAVLPLAAQAPKGWMVRADASKTATDPDAAGSIKFTTMGSGFRAVTPQAAVFWTPADAATGNYSLKGRFTLIRPSDHVNYYGLVFGGSALDGASESYLYFMVAQDGTWLIKRRTGDTTQEVSAKTPSDVVKKPDAKGTSTNALEVRVQAAKIDYLVNGTVVHSTPKSGATAKTDGLYGLRVNHLLEVQVDGFAMSKL